MTEPPERSDGFDFVDEPAGARDELPTHTSRVEAWRPKVESFLRGRYGLPFVVVAAVLALLVGRALLHERPSGAPSTPAPSTSVTLDARNGRPVTPLPRRTGADPTRCPGLQCYTSPSVPAAVRTAVRVAFPTVTFGAAETIRLVSRAMGDPLWYRELDARVGTATLTVTVKAHAAGDIPDGRANDDGHQAVTYVNAASQDWFVRLRVTDRSGTAEPFDQLRALVDDPRLLAT